MRIFNLAFIILVITCSISLAQKTNNTWCFGHGAGLNFNSGSPVPFSGSAMSTDEGCSSISDNNGSLLFYTDGSTVYNRNNTAMPNGNGLTGNSSSTQSALIVKQPGSPNLYYVFVTWTGLYYSIVDMNLNGGLGDIVAGQKNILLISNSEEKICGTPHANGTDVWIMTNEMSTNGFNAFLLSSTGLNTTPVHSNTGMVNSLNGAYGQMKFDCKGDRVAFGIADESSGQNYTMFVGDFDNSTGIVSNGYNLRTDLFQIYGVEFSPSGRYLYGAINWAVVQFDLNAGSQAAVQATEDTIALSYSYPFDGLQLGPDNKIYMADGGASTASVVNSPDLGGSACNVSVHSVSLGNATIGLDFPSIVNYQCAQLLPPMAVTDTFTNVTCYDSCNGSASVSITQGKPPYHVAWLPSGDTTTAINNLCVGQYIVRVTDQSDSLFIDTITISGPAAIQVNVSAPKTSICSYDSVLVSASPGFVNYAWNVSGTDSTIEVNQPGAYYVTVTDSHGCKKESNHLSITVNAAPVANVTGNNKFCAGDSAQICATPNFNSYSWNTGQTGSCIYATRAQNYYVLVTDSNNCTAQSNHMLVNVYPVSPISITAHGDTLSSYGSTSYTWYFNDTIISGDTSSVYIAPVSGQYQVGIVDTNGCRVVSTPTSVTVTGFDNITKQKILVYPNPFNNEIHFTSQQPLQFIIRDYLGREIQSGIADKIITTKDIAAGAYLLFLSDKENYFVVRMIKE